MSSSRREVIQKMTVGLAGLASAGVAGILPGCSSNSASSSPRMGVAWPNQGRSPRAIRTQPVVANTRPISAPVVAPAGGLNVLSRRRWTTSAPRAGQTRPMNGVTRLTVHHEGSQSVNFTAESTTRDRLVSILSTHTGSRGWGDIGYHYIIDRAGRIWEGRPADRQGAHVSGGNEHNLGVMVLGNFEQQSPTQDQLDSLLAAMRYFKSAYRLDAQQIFTHRELDQTACPGRALQPSIDTMRSRYV